MGLQADMNTLLRGIDLDVEQKINAKMKEFHNTLDDTLKSVDEKIIAGVELKIEYETKKTNLKGIKHHKFPELLATAGQRIPVMLVGQAGTGKTYAGEQVAKALGLDFYAISVGSQTSKTDIVGYMNATGEYVTTAFRKAYEKGGVFVMDEIDAGNSNVTIQLNSALSSDFCSFPDKMVRKHKDFIFIATANTFGHGASREYVGRNQLDAATLDRFVTIEWQLDESLEKKLVSVYKQGERWLKVVRAVREYADKNGLRVLITPRASIHGARLLEQNMKPTFVVSATLLGSAPEKSFEDIQQVALQAWTEGVDDDISEK